MAKLEEFLKNYCGGEETIFLPNHPYLQWEGRNDYEAEMGPVWVYPASYVRIRFRGSSLKAVVTNRKAYWENSLGYLLDGREGVKKLQDEGISVLEFETDDGEDIHELLLYKRQDSCHMVQVHGFIGSADIKLQKPIPLPSRCIEVYGDSVSAGEVSEAVEYCGLPDPEHNGEYSNSYYSYAWITARKLNARLHDIAQGGIAMQDGIGWFEEPHQIGMESVYDKIQYQPVFHESKQWNFAAYDPQVVIVALGQNDSHPEDFMTEDYEGAKAEAWRVHYAAFIEKLRKIHPQAHIICMTTILNHSESWDRAIGEACKRVQDEKVHHFLFSNNGRGTQGHIRIPEAEQMAVELAAYIESLGEEIWWDVRPIQKVMQKARAGESVKLGFLGGSITQGSLSSKPETCYAYLTWQWWKEHFPAADIRYVNAGIGGTTSHFGVARVEEDLLVEQPDVVFVEFSVNDDDTEHFRECYEGLVRRILKCSWKPAVILLHNRFYDDGKSAQRVHRSIGEHYRLPCIGLGDAIYPRIASGELDRNTITPDGLHPNDRGHRMLADVIGAALQRLDEQALVSDTELCELPLPEPYTENKYEHALRYRNFNIKPVSCKGFEVDDREQTDLGQTFRRGWYASEKGAEITFTVEGSCIAVQYRKTIQHPAPKAVAIIDGKESEGVLLDADFEENWGDCLYLQPLLESHENAVHTLTIKIIQNYDAAQLPFYLVAMLVAGNE